LWERVPERRRSRARAGEGVETRLKRCPLTRLASLADLSHQGER
jgi:hypothetical protein